MEGKIYKIADNLFIHENNRGRGELIYVEDPLNEKYIPILNMKWVERKVDELIQDRFKTSDTYFMENLELFDLFRFLLRVRLYEEYIGNGSLGYIPLDEYNYLIDSNYLAFIIAEYLSNKEHLYEENKAIIRNFNIFNKLYSLFKDPNFNTSRGYLKSLYNRFVDFIRTEI